MAQLSEDCFAHGGRLMTTAEALQRLDAVVDTVAETTTVALAEALGRVLAAPVAAGLDVPAHDNSAVDGYAVYFDDLDPDGETRLPVTGRIAAGHPLGRPAKRGEALRIFTGAPIPDGQERPPDTVMMQEDCRVEDDRVVIRPGIKRGANRRLAGEDVHAGSTILEAGHRLRPQDIGLAASVGRTALQIYAPLKVALFSTGDELREPGGELPAGCIYDSNRHTVTALLRGLDCRVTDLGILPDREDAIRDALRAAAAEHDAVFTSGGVSVGEEDHVKAAVEALGALYFWRLAIKPGRPVALGQVGRVPFVGLPGNPVAVVVCFLTVARPLLLRLGGARDLAPTHYRVRADFDHKKKRDRREYLRARLVQDADGQLAAVKFPRDGAGILSSLVEADGLVELPEALTTLTAGSMVDFLPFNEVRL
jgi:molybdopterin molybdotransferase